MYSLISAFYAAERTGNLPQEIKESTTLNMTRAVGKALGMDTTSSSLDGYILFSNLSNQSGVSWSYDYTRSSAAPSNSLDFLSTAIHEIGHILGFVSGIDQPGWLNNVINWGTATYNGVTYTSTDYINSLDPIIKNTNPLDLFRKSASIVGWQGVDDMSYGSRGGDKYFSIDSGRTSIASFATGADTGLGGDGYQASHWKAGISSIMAPTLKTGQRANVSATDLRAMDVIGWDVASTGINTAINLSTVQSQAKQSLANRLGTSVSWLDANSLNAATSLTTNRDLDIYTMLENSQIYDLSRITRPSTGATSTSTGSTGGTLSQVFAQSLSAFMQVRGLFSTLDELEILPADDSLVNDSNTQELGATASVQPGMPSFAAGISNSMTPSTIRSTTTSFLDLSQLSEVSDVSSVGDVEQRSQRLATLQQAFGGIKPQFSAIAAPSQQSSVRQYDSFKSFDQSERSNYEMFETPDELVLKR